MSNCYNSYMVNNNNIYWKHCRVVIITAALRQPQFVYDREHGVDNPKEIKLNLVSLVASGYNPLHPTRILMLVVDIVIYDKTFKNITYFKKNIFCLWR